MTATENEKFSKPLKNPNFFCPLASGSKGNCLLVSTHSSKILVDAGISAKKIQERLAQLHLGLDQIDALLITHEHIDHIQGLKMLAYKHHIPIYANLGTAQAIFSQFGPGAHFHIFTTGEPFVFKNLEIFPFSIQHDTQDPVAFTITTEHTKLGICADLGFSTSLVKKSLERCHHLYLEANHEPEWVEACKRPISYKRRVLGKTGHLSNNACCETLKHLLHDQLASIHLAHLSQECNTPEQAFGKAQELLEKESLHTALHIASQECLSEPVYFASHNRLLSK